MVVNAETGSDRPASAAPCTTAVQSKLFLRLFLQNERRLYAYVLTLLPHRADADDVLQEASLVMWDKFDEHNPPGDFAAWGCRIAYFKVLDWYKKSHRSRVLFSQEMLERVAETAVEHAATLQLDARREALDGCVEKLRAADRDLLARRFAEGATTQSTAGQVEQWLHLAVVYDRAGGFVTHYIDGRAAATVPLKFDIPLTVGRAELGNWNMASHRNRTPVRYLTGCMDELLFFSRALRGQEIERLYEQRRPPF